MSRFSIFSLCLLLSATLVAEEMDVIYERPQSQLEEAKGQGRVEPLLGLSRLYLNIGDKEEALEIWKEAEKLAPLQGGVKQLKEEILGPPPSPIERLRAATAEAEWKVRWVGSLQHDSNIIQEALSNTTPSNKDDVVAASQLFLMKSLKRRQGFSPTVSYFNLVQSHAENENLDIVGQVLNLSLLRVESPKLVLTLPFTFSHFFNDQRALMWNAEFGPGVNFKHSKGQRSSLFFGIKTTEYLRASLSSLEGQSYRLTGSHELTYEKGLRPIVLSASLQGLVEDLEDESSAYRQWRGEVGISSQEVLYTKDTLRLSYRYQDRL